MQVDNIDRYGKYSRLRFYRLVYDENAGAKRIGMRDKRFIEQAKFMPYNLYSVPAKYEFRPDLVSLEFYGTPKLWWIISGVNDLNHPIKQMAVGTTLKIPEPANIETLLM